VCDGVPGRVAGSGVAPGEPGLEGVRGDNEAVFGGGPAPFFPEGFKAAVLFDDVGVNHRVAGAGDHEDSAAVAPEEGLPEELAVAGAVGEVYDEDGFGLEGGA